MVPFIQQFVISFIENHPEVEITIFTLKTPKGTSYFWKGIKVIPMNISTKNKINQIIDLVKSSIKINRFVQRQNIDGILSFWYQESALLGKIASKLYGVKHYTWLQGQDVFKQNLYFKYFKPKSSQLIALSNFQNNVLAQEFNLKTNNVCPIVVNPGFFPKLNLNERSIDIFGAGSFIPLKNYHLFINVILELKKTYPNLNVVLAGNGPLEVELQSSINKLGLENTITLTGLLSHKETMNYMNNSKIFLHTSKFEGGGMVLYEALYSGCQVISSIPIEKEKSEFHFCNTKEKMIYNIQQILKKPLKAKRVTVNNIEKSTVTIYQLFFN